MFFTYCLSPVLVFFLNICITVLAFIVSLYLHGFSTFSVSLLTLFNKTSYILTSSRMYVISLQIFIELFLNSNKYPLDSVDKY